MRRFRKPLTKNSEVYTAFSQGPSGNVSVAVLRSRGQQVPQGYYTVNATPDQQDIVFHSLANSTAPIPDDQVALMSAIEQTIPVLRKVFQGRHSEFSRYFNNLLSLAQGGLVGSDAQPAVAQRALLNLRTEVVDNEAEREKTRYMANIGKLAAF